MVSIQRPLFDAVTFWGMLLIVIIMASVWIVLLARLNKRFGVAAFILIFVVVGINVIGDRLGWFTRLDSFPPPFVVMNIAILLMLLILGIGYAGQAGDILVSNISEQTLIALQIFRLPLEFLMLRAAYRQIMPMEFSMIGYNLDVLTGLGALLLTIYMNWRRTLPKMIVWVWNVMGIICLIIIGVLAALTSPNLHAFGTEQSHINSWILYFPYSLLPSVLVSFAVFSHILLTRKLLQSG